MGKYAEAADRTEIRPGQGTALSSGAVALPGALSGGRQTGDLQQPRQAQHKALCDGQEELFVLQYTGGTQSSAVLYSLIETAKEISLDLYRYLLWVLECAPELAQASDETWAEKLIPAKAPAECKANV